MSKLIIFDYEVFSHDTLQGAIIINEDSSIDVMQTWDLQQIKNFYKSHIDDYWIGHNNSSYDNFILEGVVNGMNEEEIKALSDRIIGGDRFRKLQIPLKYFDLMKSKFYSLKAVEAFMGKAISETQVDFNQPTKLSAHDKELTEKYNFDDLEQTFDDFIQLKNEFVLRLDMIKEFGLPEKALHMTGTAVAATVLKAKQIPGIENMVIEPILWPNLQVKHKECLDFYINKTWAQKGARLVINIAGCDFIMSAGGIHAALKNFHAESALYFDVSGYYNLLMINLNLYPRTIPEEGKAKYIYMYHEQLRLKTIDQNKRGIFKTILLCVWGAMKNQYCDFYDPYMGNILLLSGQLFLIDLCEKLEGKAQIVQANTDGVIAIPINGTTDEEIKAIIDEWQTRTGFVLKFDKIYDIHQRDVNNYMYRDKHGEITTVGESVTHYEKWVYPFWKNSFSAKEPIIVTYCIVEYFMFNKTPEETVEKYKDNLRMFQYICNKLSFDYLEYEETLLNGETYVYQLQHINRAFAWNDKETKGMIYKCKHSGARNKVSNLPDSVFVYNDEILSDNAKAELTKKIDYQYYVTRGYERIAEFVNLDYIRKIKI